LSRSWQQLSKTRVQRYTSGSEVAGSCCNRNPQVSATQTISQSISKHSVMTMLSHHRDRWHGDRKSGPDTGNPLNHIAPLAYTVASLIEGQVSQLLRVVLPDTEGLDRSSAASRCRRWLWFARCAPGTRCCREDGRGKRQSGASLIGILNTQGEVNRCHAHFGPITATILLASVVLAGEARGCDDCCHCRSYRGAIGARVARPGQSAAERSCTDLAPYRHLLGLRERCRRYLLDSPGRSAPQRPTVTRPRLPARAARPEQAT
jgi:hypothetical protein